ncbi:hypothetical protein SETIT_5G268200v2 [Setaria italica]|uniref:Uncharacterized protein n=1 Tax=Setaria italica TaxID=4555 RepID=A0A368RAU4_SETIT|nr:hypothetical protein SETIT_5G268200v2 [Setaria italica]
MVPTTTMTCSAGCKRARAMVIDDPVPAVEERTKRTLPAGPPAEAGAMVLYKAPHIHALPLKAVPLAAGREEPPCLRKHYLLELKLRADLPVHFVGERILKNSDLNGQQNRFRLPGDGDVCVLHKILSPEDLQSANLLHEIATTPKTLRRQSEPDNGAAEEQGEQGKSKKMTGREHGGLRMKLVDLIAGDKELLLLRWDSKKSVIIKGEGYLDFIKRCSLKENDVVEVWAFKQHLFYNFGKIMCYESPLHVLIVKKDQQPRCKYCSSVPSHSV